MTAIIIPPMTKSNRNIREKLLNRLAWEAGKLERIRFWYLATRINVKILNTLNVFFHSVVSMVILGWTAHLTSWPLIFPSLGPTIFLLFYSPSSPMASPRNTVLAHAAGAFTGWACFHVLILLVPGAESVAQTEPLRIAAAAAALGLCGMFMSTTGIVHPPAASTTLIAALGYVDSLWTMAMLCTAVVMLCALAWVMHRFSGIKYPVWRPLVEWQGPELATRLGRLSVASSTPERGNLKDVATRLATRQMKPWDRSGHEPESLPQAGTGRTS
ncbi:MAG TPA: HPP family protein [Thermodesulfobacteriaceae bacterium]|nr:HPP family protein [Thermodesulfobacteriaceae bacterium]